MMNKQVIAKRVRTLDSRQEKNPAKQDSKDEGRIFGFRRTSIGFM